MQINYICAICNAEFKTGQGISGHIKITHKDYTTKQYYLKFIHESTGFCKLCGKPTNYKKFKIKNKKL